MIGAHRGYPERMPEHGPEPLPDLPPSLLVRGVIAARHGLRRLREIGERRGEKGLREIEGLADGRPHHTEHGVGEPEADERHVREEDERSGRIAAAVHGAERRREAGEVPAARDGSMHASRRYRATSKRRALRPSDKLISNVPPAGSAVVGTFAAPPRSLPLFISIR